MELADSIPDRLQLRHAAIRQRSGVEPQALDNFVAAHRKKVLEWSDAMLAELAQEPSDEPDERPGA